MAPERLDVFLDLEVEVLPVPILARPVGSPEISDDRICNRLTLLIDYAAANFMQVVRSGWSRR